MSRLTFRALSPTSVQLVMPEGDGTLLAFAGCNYLGLSTHPQVHAALISALGRFGISASASRQTTGNVSVHEDLESALADHMGTDSAILTPEGYTANMALAEVLARRRPVALIDARSHRSIGHAMQAAGIECRWFPHGHVAAAAEAVQTLRRAESGRPILLATDGVFAADGSIAPLPELIGLLGDGDLLLVDDCHGLGTLGPRGEGTLRHWSMEQLDASGPQVCITTTLGKALGCYGGAVLGSTAVVSEIQERSSIYRATTPTPPAIAAAALEALRLCREEPEHLRRLRANAARLREVLAEVGIECPTRPTPVVAFTLADEAAMERLHRRLLEQGILAPLIDYPGGPAARYFRLSVSAPHTEEDLLRLRSAMAMGQLG